MTENAVPSRCEAVIMTVLPDGRVAGASRCTLVLLHQAEKHRRSDGTAFTDDDIDAARMQARELA